MFHEYLIFNEYVPVCIYAYVHLHIWLNIMHMYMHVCVQVHIHLIPYIQMCICRYIFITTIYTNEYMRVYIYIKPYIQMYLCMYAYTHMYTYLVKKRPNPPTWYTFKYVCVQICMHINMYEWIYACF